MNPFLKYLPIVLLAASYIDEFAPAKPKKTQYKSVKRSRSVKKMNRGKKRKHGRK